MEIAVTREQNGPRSRFLKLFVQPVAEGSDTPSIRQDEVVGHSGCGFLSVRYDFAEALSTTELLSKIK